MNTLVKLDTPIKRGETLITNVEVLKPNAGALRGVRLADVANADVDALLIVLPRITSPQLTQHECAQLGLPDMVALAGQVIGFLSPKSDELASPQA
ncbi:phage tail assembly protein [Sodalis sp. RH15]|uniref:phage tail assembly protein n=1 Tax=Sodalis sp. RH15 TaxID=3394330 RepID=UPI0039B4DAFF